MKCTYNSFASNLSLAIIASVVVCSGQTMQPLPCHAEKASKAESNKKSKANIDAETSKTTSTPITAQDFFDRAKTKSLRGDYKGAIADYTECVKLDPKNAKAYNNRGSLYNAINDEEKARKDYDQAISVDPSLALPYYNRANHFRVFEEYDKAITDYNKAISINPDYANAYFNRARIYEDQSHIAEAIDDYRKAAELYKTTNNSKAAKDAEKRASKLKKNL